MSETEYNNMFHCIWGIWGIWFGGGILEARGYDESAVGKDMGALEPREIGISGLFRGTVLLRATQLENSQRICGPIWRIVMGLEWAVPVI
jgi:hypothetical protein